MICVCGGDFITHAHNVTLFPAITFPPDSQQGVTVSNHPGVLPRAPWFLGTLLLGHLREPLLWRMEAPKLNGGTGSGVGDVTEAGSGIKSQPRHLLAM